MIVAGGSRTFPRESERSRERYENAGPATHASVSPGHVKVTFGVRQEAWNYETVTERPRKFGTHNNTSMSPKGSRWQVKDR